MSRSRTFSEVGGCVGVCVWVWVCVGVCGCVCVCVCPDLEAPWNRHLRSFRECYSVGIDSEHCKDEGNGCGKQSYR